MATYSNSAREVEMPDGNVVVLHSEPTGGANTTSNIKKFKYDDNGHVTESEAANATDLNLNSYSTPTTGSTAIGTSDAVQTAIGKLDHQSQIDQSNILYGLNTGVKNLLTIKSTYTNNGLTSVQQSDGYTVKITGTPTGGKSIQWSEVIKITESGTYKVKLTLSGTMASCYLYDVSASALVHEYYSSNTYEETLTANHEYAMYTYSQSAIDATISAMLCTAAAYTQSSDYIAPALPNYDLTRLEAEDRAALAEEIDAGAKNKAPTASIVKTATTPSFTPIIPCSFPAGTYHVKFNYTMGNVGTFCLKKSDASTTLLNLPTLIPTGTGTYEADFTINEACGGYNIYGENTANLSNIMICTKAAFGVSNKFVPFGNDPFYQVPINHNMIYRGRNLGATLTDAQHTALSSGNFTDLYLGDYWTKTVTIPAGTYTGGDGEEVTVSAQTNITLKAVIADFDTFYAGYASTYAGINTHHAAVIVTGFSNVVWNKTNSTAGGYVASLIHKWLVGSALPQIETWFGSAKVLSHQKLLTNAITGDAASGWAWSSQQISLLSENQMYGSKVWGNSKASNGGYEPGEAFKHLNVFNHIDANLLFGNKNIWLRDISSAVRAASMSDGGDANNRDASDARIAPAALILLS